MGRGKGIFVAVVVLVVGAAVIGGLILAGSPAKERMRRLDAQRVADLHSISRSIDLFWTRNSRLPESLEELSAEADPASLPQDPVTAEPYEYRTTGDDVYDLCARFELAFEGGRERVPSNGWSHGAGRWCFEMEAHELSPGVRPHPDTTATR